MTAALFDVPGPPPGNVRATLDAHLDRLRADGHVIAEDLAVVAQSLADRLDFANAARASRGYVMLSAEYRAARRDLLEGIAADGGGIDPLEAALADFRNAQAGHPA